MSEPDDVRARAPHEGVAATVVDRFETATGTHVIADVAGTRIEARADSLRLPAAAKKKLTIQRLPNPPRVEIRSTYTETVHIPWYGDKVLTFTPFAEAPL